MARTTSLTFSIDNNENYHFVKINIGDISFTPTEFNKPN